MTAEEYDLLERKEIFIADQINAKSFSERKGHEEGMEKGMEKGHKEGREEGREEGKEETRTIAIQNSSNKLNILEAEAQQILFTVEDY